jgi:hypothetical protein
VHEADREQLASRPGHLRAVQRFRQTIIAAEMTGRSCHAIELIAQYVDVAIEHWQGFSGETATLEVDGRSFAEVSAERLGEGKKL